MNKKLIAAAVASAVIAPVASQADATVYGRINNAIDLKSPDTGDGTTEISDVSSRFGVKASADIGNGLTANGKYEFATVTDNSESGVSGTRVATVGLSGSFGRVDIGNQWSAYFDTVGTLISPTYALGSHVYFNGGGPYRTANTIKYSNTFGPVYLELDYRLDGSNEAGGDGYGLGLNFAVTDNITIAASIDSESEADVVDEDTETVTTEPAESLTGIAINAKFGGYWVNFGFQNHGVDDDMSTVANDEKDIASNFLYVGGSIGEKTGWLVGSSQLDDGDSETEDDGSQTTWGVYHNLGSGLRLYVESTSVTVRDADTGRSLLGMRFDF